MHSANRFPVLVYDRDARQAYERGGLAAKAQDVADAGRFDDTHIIHVTDDELNMLRQQWGDPTINPHTGMPEFGLFGSLFKAFKKIAPIAVSFIPGVGPVAGAALGAGMGALSGGGLKGALMGGLSGALGGAGAAGKIGGGLLPGASQVVQKSLGDAILGGALGAATGQNPLRSALMAGGTTFLRGQLAPRQVTQAPAETPATPAEMVVGSDLSVPVSTQAQIDAAASAPVAKPNFWGQRPLQKFGIGIQNKYLVPGVVGAALLSDVLKPKDKPIDEAAAREKFFGPTFNARGPGGFQLASLASGVAPESPMAEYARQYFAEGGFAVHGPGTGRSDEIPAMLSDGEYVMDAETVSLLGDGSTKAGAKKLDDLRVKIRKHKGKKLAKGKFSHDAKPADKYMAGGRI